MTMGKYKQFLRSHFMVGNAKNDFHITIQAWVIQNTISGWETIDEHKIKIPNKIDQ